MVEPLDVTSLHSDTLYLTYNTDLFHQTHQGNHPLHLFYPMSMDDQVKYALHVHYVQHEQAQLPMYTYQALLHC